MSGYSRLESPADSPGRSSNIRFQQLTHRRAADSPSRAARGGGPAHDSSEVDAGAHYTPSRSRSPHGTRPHETGSDSEPSRSGHHGLQASVTVVLQGEGSCSGSEASGGDCGNTEAAAVPAEEGAVFMSQQELEEMITWETKNLYDYLRGLYARGLEEAQAGHEFDKEAWEQRMAHLRRLLQQRDVEVEELQRVLGEREEAVGERDVHIAQQAELIREQAEQIRDLLRQCAAQQRGSSGRIRGPEEDTQSADAEAPLPAQWHYKKAAALPQAAPAYERAHFVQLPPQQTTYLSYQEHEGCGFLQSVKDSFWLHRKRWLLGAGSAALLLLIILLATLIPASKRRSSGPAPPAFLQAPSIAAMGAGFFDVAVQLDQPAIVSYMLFQSSDLLQQVAGTGSTLLDLIQAKGVSGAAVVDASAPTASLQPPAPQPGLQQLAAACGWAPVLHGSQNQRVTLASVASAQSAACTATDVQRRCARCPRIVEGTAYTILMVASTPSGDGVGEVQVLNSVAQAQAVNINSVSPPFATNITANSFVLHVRLNVPGTVFYAVLHDTTYTPYGPYSLLYQALAPSTRDILNADPAAFTGALVAGGNFSVPAANEWATAAVQPPCVAALCQQSRFGLLGNTSYNVYLAAVDAFGNLDPSPLVVPLATAPDTAPPALLPASGPTAITASGFGVTLSMDAAGAAYYMLLAVKPGVELQEPAVEAGSWAALSGLPGAGGSRRRRLFGDGGELVLGGLAAGGDSGGSSSGSGSLQRSGAGGHRLLATAAPAAGPGSLVAPTCYSANVTCQASPTAVFTRTPGLSAFNVVASGCTQGPPAGQTFALPPASGLQNNTLYYLLVATEGWQVPSPALQGPPTVYTVRTVDLSAARFGCGFPTVTNITASSLAVSVLLTKPAWAFWVVIPSSQVGSAPSAADILRGQGAGGQGVAAAGNMTRSGSLPWEAPGSGAGDSRKLWASVGGLQSGVSYTVFVALTLDGNAPLPGAPVARVSDVFTPATAPPTITAVQAVNVTVDEAAGSFSLALNATLDRPGVVYYALYRAYSCISGDPSVSDILSGASLAPSICPCSESWYCSLVTAGNVSAAGSGQVAAAAIRGGLAPLPFESLRNAPESQLRCFRGGLGQATDTYNIYLAAASALPTYTGLAPQCSNFAQAAATAAAAAAGGGRVDGNCAAAPSIVCAQAQLRPDVRIVQSGPVVAWEEQAGGGAAGAGGVSWQPPSGTNTYARPARVQLSLESGELPAFTRGPEFPVGGQQKDALFMQFSLDRPALLLYAVRSFPRIDPASGDLGAPVLVSTGRVPVFEAGAVYNATIRACVGEGWPLAALAPNAQYTVQFVARDKYGRADGPCPPALPSCLATTTTALA